MDLCAEEMHNSLESAVPLVGDIKVKILHMKHAYILHLFNNKK